VVIEFATGAGGDLKVALEFVVSTFATAFRDIGAYGSATSTHLNSQPKKFRAAETHH